MSTPNFRGTEECESKSLHHSKSEAPTCSHHSARDSDFCYLKCPPDASILLCTVLSTRAGNAPETDRSQM